MKELFEVVEGLLCMQCRSAKAKGYVNNPPEWYKMPKLAKKARKRFIEKVAPGLVVEHNAPPKRALCEPCFAPIYKAKSEAMHERIRAEHAASFASIDVTKESVEKALPGVFQDIEWGSR